jgi:environmental stress-induced protein Ves
MTRNSDRVRLLALADVPATPWRNGKGVTRELIAWPDADAWTLRFSVADIENDGPFSPWPGVVRDFCVLEGAGVVLSWDDGRKERLTRGREPLRFDGGDAPWAQLIEGPTRDLNLMTRDKLDARLQAADHRARSRPWACFAAERGRMTLDGTASFDVPPLTLVWFGDPPRSAAFDHRGWWIVRGAA